MGTEADSRFNCPLLWRIALLKISGTTCYQTEYVKAILHTWQNKTGIQHYVCDGLNLHTLGKQYCVLSYCECYSNARAMKLNSLHTIFSVLKVHTVNWNSWYHWWIRFLLSLRQTEYCAVCDAALHHRRRTDFILMERQEQLARRCQWTCPNRKCCPKEEALTRCLQEQEKTCGLCRVSNNVATPASLQLTLRGFRQHGVGSLGMRQTWLCYLEQQLLWMFKFLEQEQVSESTISALSYLQVII